jgi:quinol monooxygenase YgiN
MVTIYCTFEVPEESRAAFDDWFLGLAQECQREEGCIAYDYLQNPQHPGRCTLFEAWDGDEHFQAHLYFHAHVDMIAFGTSRWGMRNIVVHTWREGGYAKRELTSTEQAVDEQLLAVVRERQLQPA